MSSSFFRSPSSLFFIDTYVPDEWPTTHKELKLQLAKAALWLARAKNRDEARAARKLIDLILLDLGQLYPIQIGRTRISVSRAHASPPKVLRLARTKYRR